jgi:glycosyltransferase involved in cell wall biosynthesis
MSTSSAGLVVLRATAGQWLQSPCGLARCRPGFGKRTARSRNPSDPDQAKVMPALQVSGGPVSKIRPENSPAGVDVAIPCYQYGRFLRDCVTSVLTQGLGNLRILIIDNASTDNSLEVAQQLATEDCRVTYAAHRRNLGPHASFNEGIEWASAKYFMILCADDLLAPGCLARAASVLERHSDVVFAYGRAASVRPGDPIHVLPNETPEMQWRILPGAELLERFCRTGVCHIQGSSTMLVRTNAQKIAGRHRASLEHSDDFEMWMRLARLGAVAETDGQIAHLRMHGSNRSAFSRQTRSPGLSRHERDRMLYLWHDLAAFESFFTHEGASLPEVMRLRALAMRSLGERAYWSALAYLCRRQAWASLDLWRLAFSLSPMTAILPPVGYLFRRDDLLRRIRSVASDMLGSSHPRRSDRSRSMLQAMDCSPPSRPCGVPANCSPEATDAL